MKKSEGLGLLVADDIAVPVLDPGPAVGVPGLAEAVGVHGLDAAVGVLAPLVLLGVNLALPVGVLDELGAVAVDLDAGAVGQARLLAAVGVDELADVVGEEDLARAVGVVLLELAGGELEEGGAVGVDDLRDGGVGVEVGLGAAGVVQLLAVAVEEVDGGGAAVAAHLLHRAVREHGHRAPVLQPRLHHPRPLLRHAPAVAAVALATLATIVVVAVGVGGVAVVGRHLQAVARALLVAGHVGGGLGWRRAVRQRLVVEQELDGFAAALAVSLGLWVEGAGVKGDGVGARLVWVGRGCVAV